jgi:hypothetical protein
MVENKGLCWSGIGRHTANDFLHLMGIFPGTPSYVICSDLALWTDFKLRFEEYMKQWGQPEYLNAVTCSERSNPFEFNQLGHRAYLSKYIIVFRRTYTMVPQKLYNQLVQNGLLNPSHIIGLSKYDFFSLLLNLTLLDRTTLPRQIKWIHLSKISQAWRLPSAWKSRCVYSHPCKKSHQRMAEGLAWWSWGMYQFENLTLFWEFQSVE